LALSAESQARIDKLHRERFEVYERMWCSGSLLGVPAALHHSIEYGCPLPSWVAGAAFEMICDLLKREKSNKRGRAAGVLARYRQDYIDLIRWNEVIVLEERQKRLNQALIDYASVADTFPEFYQSELRRAEWFGSTRSRIFECVSEVLEDTEAFGSPLSIKRSYLAVERNNRHPTTACRYAFFDRSLLECLGVDPDFCDSRKLLTWRTSTSRAPTNSRMGKFVAQAKKRPGK
jgi:hypothetical protein